ncbi:MAG: Gfo/Idh/MocA family oxidoreductase, partial [Planctomycetes bacterium]|nr:Gfo/Idh/MocA family oxidoreductase [Planctomycetota bacterium]
MNNKKGCSKKIVTRRKFIKSMATTAGAALASPYFVPASMFGAQAPSNRINLGCIGVGRMGRGDINDIYGFEEIQIVATCDVDVRRVLDGKKLVEDNYAKLKDMESYRGCSTYGDYRELIDRDDIDAVMICTPDHWHILAALEAAKAGKDIFVQKPLSLTIEEGRVLSDTVRRYGNIFQLGSQQRSDQKFRFACELVRNGRIGKLHTVLVGFDI